MLSQESKTFRRQKRRERPKVIQDRKIFMLCGEETEVNIFSEGLISPPSALRREAPHPDDRLTHSTGLDTPKHIGRLRNIQASQGQTMLRWPRE